ncbi:MAG: hypothetical protein LBH05_00350 [Deferribacteraceae bacterium]|jgi:hypothetical protein|nr:hypothetical protein [Deferribacteraceae bacterium]
MGADIEQKMLLNGDTVLRLARVTDGGYSNRFLGNILISRRHLKEGSQEIFSVLVQPLTSTSSIVRKESDKLSINKFEATVHHTDRTISLGPIHGAQIEEAFQNRGVGTFLLNDLITALRSCCPQYNFNPYEFTLPENVTMAEREKIIGFLSKFNISMGFSDIEQRTGIIRAGQPQQLVNYVNPDKITELNLEDFIFQMLNDRNKNENEINNLKAEISRMGEETFNGIPKKQLAKYTLIGCGVTLFLIFILTR